MEKTAATTGIVKQAQLLTSYIRRPEREISHEVLKALSSAQLTWHTFITKGPLCMFASMTWAKLYKDCMILKQECLDLRTKLLNKPVGNPIDKIYMQ